MHRAIILGYHNIGIPPKGIRMRSLYVSMRNFEFQMWYLKKAGFNVVSLNAILDFINDTAQNHNLVSLTFDDGYHDFYEHAFPVLKKYRYPATVFIVSDLVGKENRWDSDTLQIKKLMDWEQIAELKEHGVSVGSHSKTHPFLINLSPNELIAEVSDSKHTLEQKMKSTVNYFCYPYGNHNEEVIAAVKKAGYLGALISRRGFIIPGDNTFTLKRISVKWNTHPASFIYKLHSDYEIRKGSIA